MFGVAKLVGEGYEKPSGDSEMPLDVNYAKIVDWMVRVMQSQCYELKQAGFGLWSATDLV